jgi:hypothetical protein
MYLLCEMTFFFIGDFLLSSRFNKVAFLPNSSKFWHFIFLPGQLILFAVLRYSYSIFIWTMANFTSSKMEDRKWGCYLINRLLTVIRRFSFITLNSKSNFFCKCTSCDFMKEKFYNYWTQPSRHRRNAWVFIPLRFNSTRGSISVKSFVFMNNSWIAPMKSYGIG